MAGLASVAIGADYLNRCSTPVQGQGSPNVFVSGLGQATISFDTIPYQDIVPCPTCCQTYVAPLIGGSANVFVSGLSASRISDEVLGLSGTIPALVGSPNVFIG